VRRLRQRPIRVLRLQSRNLQPISLQTRKQLPAANSMAL
jgi:hypothetical protein